MNNIETTTQHMEKQETTTWSKEIKTGNLTKSIRVEKVNGGFITTVSKYGRESDDKDAPYVDSSERFISDYNPLEKTMEKEDDSVDKKSSVIDSIKELGDFLSV